MSGGYNSVRGIKSVSSRPSVYTEKRSSKRKHKMSWRQRLARLIAGNNKDNDWVSIEDDIIRETDTPRGDPAMNFKIYNTHDGNKIVEFYSYDRLKDNATSKLYVINGDENFGDAVAKIAMMHQLSGS